jgi:hypothetical protein
MAVRDKEKKSCKVSTVQTNKQFPYVNESIVEEATAKIKPSPNESSGRYAKMYREINAAPLSAKMGAQSTLNRSLA